MTQQGCGGRCSGRPRLKFLTHPATASSAGTPGPLQFVGSAMAPTMIPDHLVRPLPGTGLLAYESLYTGLTPGGETAPAIIPGTFGQYATKARVGR